MLLDIAAFIIIGIFFGVCVGVTLSNNYIFSKLNLRKTSAQICLGSLLLTIVFGWLELKTRNPFLEYPYIESFLNIWLHYVTGFFFILFWICIWYIFFKKKKS